VIIVVVVFITNCHVSENPKIGPVKIQLAIKIKAIKKAQTEPTARDNLWENLLKKSFMLR